jgi:rubrerythrin
MNDNAQALEMLTVALGMEEKGKKFYDEAIAKCDNEIGREIFTTLRNDEMVHVERIKEIFSSLETDNTWKEGWLDEKHVKSDLKPFFKDLAKKHKDSIKTSTSDIEALNVGIDFEQRSVTYYTEQLDRANDPIEKKFIEMMVREERDHFTVLTDLKFYLSDPAAWFVEQEHQGFDG